MIVFVIISVFTSFARSGKSYFSIASNYSDNLLIIENNGYAPALKILEKISIENIIENMMRNLLH
ncbi:hypothetical protein OFQ59_10185 [Brachyspira hyodysenteriae]|uniref:hypothetical protein n=1 Tax=Brachyspira hyodysenteriae TaxID=159 RepID=UPI0022CE2E2F|nr:hypothetical protein [Brachyspira hyodysenteriae]MCZ9970448.1 hypothetical protein [Brachyspira hyodysenteriae]